MDYITQTILFTLLILSVACGQQQYFRVQPRNTTIQEGGEVLLECEVANLAGQVQWTKDGFALGFSAVIAGFPRYSVVGDRRHGIYNLRVSNASLEDDAEYQCQVGPSRQHKAIRANAKLNVTSPPSSVEIMDYMSNSKIEIRENQELRLECVVRNAKPAARIVWYRGKVELNIPNQETQIVEVPGKNGDRRITRYDTHSRIAFKPTAEDDMTDYSCEARHDALSSPLKATVQLSVLYPPGVPYIEGYTEGEPIRRGQTVELVCKSRSGNPPAQLIWYKNGEQIRMAYRTAGRISENVYTFTADASDNKARYKCEASNVMSQAPLKAEVDMSVLFSPAQVTISGASEARVGDRVTLTCATGSSNPPAEIKWMLAGKQVTNATARTVIAPEGGWITTSNITTSIEADRRNLVAICHGLNRQLAENVVSTHTINVLYPPGQPYVMGYTEGAHIPAGTVQKLLCTSAGGNPLATLTWFKNDKKVNSAVVKSSDHSVSSELTVLTNATDNGAQYRCEATNPASEIPLFETITMNVYFPPEHVRIRKEPSEIFKPNEQATISCDSSSSNPPATISFWKDGIPVLESVNTTKQGLHGGTVSSIELTLNITEQMDGVIYTCQATNEALERSVHDSIKLRVLYKPAFAKSEESAMGIEEEPLVVVLEATGNPSEISYNWTKDGLPIHGSDRIITNGSMLNVTKLSRNDAGVYKCDAYNSQGKSTAYVNVTVKYAATIIGISENTVVSPNEDATLSCTVDGNPQGEDNVKWERDDFPDFERRTTITYHNGTSYLKITKVTRVDLGAFLCVADNGVGNATSKEVMLVVKHKPEIDDSPALLKFASDAGHTGKLICQSQAFPIARYSWARTGSPITTNTTGKYYTTFRQTDPMHSESVLYITHVTSSDYGKYECVARNELGFSTISPSLEISAPPDTPTQLRVLNVTHNTVTLSWLPGFDGGMEASYRIRYRPVLADGYSYVDVVPANSTVFTARGLDVNTQYVFSVMAMNKLGNSKYMPDILSAKTLVIDNPIEKMVSEDLLGKQDIPGIFIISGSVVASILLIVNVAVCIACQRKKAKKNREQNNQTSKTATIEMYAPSSYNDTITGETLSSVSEKSETYSNEGSQPDYTEENRKQLPNAYIMDEADYPGPYHPTCLDYELRIQPVNKTTLHHTLPHPHHHQHHHMHDANRAKEDPNIAYHRNNTLGKSSYMSAPSPAPPTDGSYFNMSDRYLTYPSPLDFQNPPQIPPHPHVLNYAPPPSHSMMTLQQSANGMRGASGHPITSAVPPPDVLYNTNQTAPILKAQKVELTHTSDSPYEVNNQTHLV